MQERSARRTRIRWINLRQMEVFPLTHAHTKRHGDCPGPAYFAAGDQFSHKRTGGASWAPSFFCVARVACERRQKRINCCPTSSDCWYRPVISNTVPGNLPMPK